ncbi:MAG: TetR family transcriptional regulator C-terminal domain-containing protein [Paracoccaceae bacterium]
MIAKPDAAPKYRRYSSAERSAMLIDAGLACLARGGILGFTTENICREAGVSRGLITHHFKSKDGLLAAIYSTMYERSLAVFNADPGSGPGIAEIVEAEFSPAVFNRETTTIWLALWGEVATNPALGREHHRHYLAYRAGVAGALKRTAEKRGCEIDADTLAVMVISLIDGLWLENCIAPDLMSAESAKMACYRMLDPFLGPLP